MSYEMTKRLIIPKEEVLVTGAADTFTWIIAAGKKFVVKGFSFIASNEAIGDATTKAVLTLDHTPSGGARAEKAKITTVAAAIGTELKQDTAFTAATEFEVGAGDTLIFERQTAAATGTTTGKGYYVLEYSDVLA